MLHSSAGRKTAFVTSIAHSLISSNSISKTCFLRRLPIPFRNSALKPSLSILKQPILAKVSEEVTEDNKNEEYESSDGNSSEKDTNSSSMKIRYPLLVTYVAFALYALILGPNTAGDDSELSRFLSGHLDDINDLFFAIFNLMGAIGVIFASVLNAGASKQSKLSTGFFSFLGTAVGLLGFGPYLIARDSAPSVTKDEVESKGVISRVLESRIFGLFPLIYSLWAYAFAFGLFTPGNEQWHEIVFYSSAVDLWRSFKTDRFVSATIIDFILLSTILWDPLTEDMRRRGWFKEGRETESILTALSFLLAPAVGPALYLVVRPRLPDKKMSS